MTFEEYQKQLLEKRAKITDYKIENDRMQRDIAINNEEIHKLEYEIQELTIKVQEDEQ